MPPRSDLAQDVEDAGLSCALASAEHEENAVPGSEAPRAELPEPPSHESNRESSAFTMTPVESAITTIDVESCLLAPSPSTCCLPGQTLHEGTDGPDTFSVSPASTPPRCVLLYAGDDQAYGGSGLDHLIMGKGDDVAAGRSGDDLILGGSGIDHLTGDSGHDLIWGGAGDDAIHAGSGNDAIRGGFGDDHIDAATGDDWILPGPGQDTVLAGSGNDTIEVRHVCELRPGESIHGGSGTDKLRAPLTSAQLATLGVSVSSIETFELVEADPAASECGNCHCALSPDGTDVICCGGIGECRETLGGSGYCDCPDGFSGSDCTYDPAEAIGNDPIPPNCQTGDPSCWKLFDASVDVLSTFGLDDLAACTDDLTKLVAYGEGIEGGEVFDLLATYPTPIGQPGVWAPGLFPVVILGTANGVTGAVDESQYADLALHLSRNGFIVLIAAPVTNDATVAARAEIMHCVHRLFPQLTVGGEPLLLAHTLGQFAYVGHSRGGEAVVMASGWDEAVGLQQPSAIVSLAPTLLCGATREKKDDGDLCGYASPEDDDPDPEWLYGILANGRTTAYLAMGASADGDTDNGLFGLFDEALAEPSVPVPPHATVLASLWTHRVHHLDWRGQSGSIPFPGDPSGPGLVASWGALLSRAYTLAFLQWQVSGAVEHRAMFVPPRASEGDQAPPCVLAPAECTLPLPPTIPSPRVLQFRDGGFLSGVTRLPVQSFSAGGLGTFGPEATGPISTSGVVVRRDLSFPDEEPDTFDETYGPFTNLRGQAAQLVAEPVPGAPAELAIGLAGLLANDPLDAPATGLSTLSFRVAIRVEGWSTPIDKGPSQSGVETLCNARRTGEGANPPHAPNDRPANLRVSLRDASSTEVTLESRDFGSILPSDIVTHPRALGGQFGCDQSEVWTTVRVPLAAFVEASFFLDPLHLAALTELRFELDVSDPEHEGQTISVLLDSVELVGGVCGDDAVDPGELCDGPDFGGETCLSLTGGVGPLACSADCQQVDTSACSLLAGCELGVPGTIGCECLPVDLDGVLGADGTFPDGPGSYGTASFGSLANGAGGLGDYCPDSEAPNTGHAICGLVPTPDEQDSVAACVECAFPGNGQAEAAYGCPCWTDADCQPTGRTGDLGLDVKTVPLTCWGDTDGGWQLGVHGTCLPAVNETAPGSGTVDLGSEIPAESLIEEFVRTIWLCKVPCGELEAVAGTDAHTCLFRGSGYAFDFASCVEETCALEDGQPPTVGQICADLGGHCGPFDFCVDECDPAENPLDLGQGNPRCPSYGYPSHYRCTTWLPRGRCAPPECELDPQLDGPGDPAICEALAYGNVNPM